MVDDKSANAPPPAGWQIKLGLAMLILSVVTPLALVPLVNAMDLSAPIAATVSGVILAGAEVLGLAAVAVMGKKGYEYIKSRILGFLKRYGPPEKVSRARYSIGLVMFILPILFGWLTPYAGDMIPGYTGNEIVFGVAGDAVLLASLFVLGGDFWDKVRALFVHGAAATFPNAG